MKRDWKQAYFYLVESYRDKEGRPRQHSHYLGKTLNMSAQGWAAVLSKVVDGFVTHVHIRGAVRVYCKKNGLPLKTADAVRAAGRLINEKRKGEELEAARRLLESQQKWQREHPEEARRVKGMYEYLLGSSAKVSKAAGVLNISEKFFSKEEVKVAFRTVAMIHHPDQGGDAAMFRQVVAARDTLFAHLGNTQSK